MNRTPIVRVRRYDDASSLIHSLDKELAVENERKLCVCVFFLPSDLSKVYWERNRMDGYSSAIETKRVMWQKEKLKKGPNWYEDKNMNET